jgi:hypothetical protein
MTTMKSPSDESRIPVPPGTKPPWPSAAEQRKYWEEREQAERITLIQLERNLSQLDGMVLKMFNDVQKLREILNKDIPDL